MWCSEPAAMSAEALRRCTPCTDIYNTTWKTSTRTSRGACYCARACASHRCATAGKKKANEWKILACHPLRCKMPTHEGNKKWAHESRLLRNTTPCPNASSTLNGLLLFLIHLGHIQVTQDLLYVR